MLKETGSKKNKVGDFRMRIEGIEKKLVKHQTWTCPNFLFKEASVFSSTFTMFKPP